MATTMQEQNRPTAYELAGGDVGILLVHGFTGAPPDLGYLARYLHTQGYTVGLPLLSGHGTEAQDMAGVKRAQWIAEVERAFSDLASRCRVTFVGGLSMGGVLSLNYAATAVAAGRPLPAGVIALASPMYTADRRAPLLPLLKYVMRWNGKARSKVEKVNLLDKSMLDEVFTYLRTPTSALEQVWRLIGETRKRLGRISVPTLIVQSRLDPVSLPPSAEIIYNGIASFSKELVWLTKSSHVITLDYERDLVCQRVASFLSRHSLTAVVSDPQTKVGV